MYLILRCEVLKFFRKYSMEFNLHENIQHSPSNELESKKFDKIFKLEVG
jgi:hypothetical protein